MVSEVHEKFIPLKEAADKLGIHLWALRRAIRRGAIPSYAPFGRKLVKLSEVVAYIDSCRQGGVDA